MNPYSVLYDDLGPRGNRRVRYATVLVTILCLIGLAVVVKRLYDQGQLASEMWSPLFNPADDQFSLVWSFLLGGLANTVKAALLAIILSLIFGTLMAILRVTAHRYYRWMVVGAIETLRGIPVVLTIFLASRVLPVYGVDLPLVWYIVIGLTVYNSVVIAEAIRAGILALPRGQHEAAMAIGLSRRQALQFVILPQAFRMMLPVIVGQLVVVVKDTSLGFIIGFEELLRRGQIAVQTLNNPLQLFLLVGIIFVTINYALSRLAEAAEARTRRRRPVVNASRTLKEAFAKIEIPRVD